MKRPEAITIPDAVFAREDLSWPAKAFLAFVIARVCAPMTLEELGRAMLGAKPRTVQAWIAELHQVGLLEYARTGRGLVLTPTRDTQDSAAQRRRSPRVRAAGNGGSETQDPAGRSRVAEIRVSESQISAHRVARARASSEEDLSQDQTVAADLDAREEPQSSSSDRSSSDTEDEGRADELWALWAERHDRVRQVRPIRHGGGDDVDLAKIARSLIEHAERDGVPFAELARQTLDLYWSAPWAQNRTNRPTIANLLEWFETYLARARKLLKPAPVKARTVVAEDSEATPELAEVADIIAKTQPSLAAGLAALAAAPQGRRR